MIAIVLGSGIGSVMGYLELSKSIDYASMVDFEITPLEGHERILYEAELGDQKLIVLSGKLHSYEGYSYEQIIAPLRFVEKHYCIDQWIITSASGGLTENVEVGEWHKISDLLTLDYIHGLGGVRSTPICSESGFTYAFQKGPSLGTVAEYRMLSTLQADLVGMSMLPESAYLRSIATDYILYTLTVCSYYPIENTITEPSHAEVITIAEAAVSKLVTILKSIISTH